MAIQTLGQQHQGILGEIDALHQRYAAVQAEIQEATQQLDALPKSGHDACVRLEKSITKAKKERADQMEKAQAAFQRAVSTPFPYAKPTDDLSFKKTELQGLFTQEKDLREQLQQDPLLTMRDDQDIKAKIDADPRVSSILKRVYELQSILQHKQSDHHWFNEIISSERAIVDGENIVICGKKKTYLGGLTQYLT